MLNSLQKRFSQLNSNFSNIIYQKNELITQNDLISKENKMKDLLREKMSEKIQNSENENKELQNKIRYLEGKLEDFNNKIIFQDNCIKTLEEKSKLQQIDIHVLKEIIEEMFNDKEDDI